MMKTMNKVLPLAVAAMFALNCKTAQKTTNEIGVDVLKFERLKRSEYKIIGNVTGSSNTQTILGIFQLGVEKQASYVDATPDAPEKISAADRAAIYNALESAPDADAVILPRFERDIFAIPLLYRQVKVTVRAKAISLNSDSEKAVAAPAPAPAPEAPVAAPAAPAKKGRR